MKALIDLNRRFVLLLLVCVWLLSLLTVPASAQEGTYPIDPSPSELTWSPSGEYLMTGYTGGFILWDGDTGDLVRRYPFLRDERELYVPFITAAVWSPDSTRLAMRIYSELRGPLLRVVAIPSGDTVWEISDAGYFTRRAWSPDGTRIATVYEPTVRADLSVRILDASNGQVLLDIPVTERGYGGKAKWSPSGTIVAVAAGDDEWGSALIFYDGITGAELGRIPHESPIRDFAWSPDGTRVVTVMTRITEESRDDQQSVRVWDVATGAMLNRFMSRLSDVDWSPTDNLLAGSIGFSIGILDLAGSILYQTEASGVAPEWKPDGTIVADIGLTPVLMTREGAVLPRRPTMLSFSIIDFEASKSFGLVYDGMQIDPTTFDVVGEPQIRSLPRVDDGGSVVFDLNGMVVVDNDWPFSIPLPPPGSYTLTATPYSEPDGQGTLGIPLTVNFTMVGEVEPPISLFPNAGPDATYYDLNNDGSTLAQLDASASTGEISSYAWTVAGNPLATGTAPLVSLPLGFHEISLAVSNAQGQSATDSVGITVAAAPAGYQALRLQHVCMQADRSADIWRVTNLNPEPVMFWYTRVHSNDRLGTHEAPGNGSVELWVNRIVPPLGGISTGASLRILVDNVIQAQATVNSFPGWTVQPPVCPQ